MAGLSRRQCLGGMAAASGGLLAAACDLSLELPGFTQSKPAVAIRVLTFPVADQETIWQEVGARFAAEHPPLTVMQQGFPMPSAPVAPHEWVNELAASGDLFDVIEVRPFGHSPACRSGCIARPSSLHQARRLRSQRLLAGIRGRCPVARRASCPPDGGNARCALWQCGALCPSGPRRTCGGLDLGAAPRCRPGS